MDNQEFVSMELANDTTNITVFLLYNETYDISLYATSCGGRLKSADVSINITTPDYQCKYLVYTDP